MLRIEQSTKSLTAKLKERLLIHLTAFKHLLTEYPTTTLLVKLIQFLMLILILFQQNFFIYLANLTSHTAINSVNNIVNSLYLSTELLITLCCVMSIILLFELSHCAMLQVEFRTQKNQTWGRRLLLVIVLLYNVFAIILVPCLYNLGKKCTQTQESIWIVLIVLIIITFWPFFIIQCTVCPILYDGLMLIVASILSLTSSNYKYLVVLVISLFQTWFKKAKFQRMMYLIVAVIAGWNFIDLQLVVSSPDTLAQDKLVSVGICILLSSYLLIKLASTWNCTDDQIEQTKILKLIQNTKTETLIQSNKFQTVFAVWKSTINFIQKSQHSLATTLRQKQIHNLTKSDLIQGLMQHVRESITSERDIDNRILYLKLKILSKSKQIEVIEGAQSLISMSTRSNLSIRQQFKLAEFQNYIVQKLFGSQNDRQVNTSFIIQKALDIEQFYNAVAKSLKQVIKFWQFFSRKFKSKQQITQFFDRIVTAQNQLRDRFESISEYNDIKRERRLMMQIEHILNGHIMISQWKSNQGYQQDQNIVQNCFVLIQQRKIIKSSFEFLNEMGFSEEELINGDWEMIFGQRFVENLEQEMREVTFESRRRVIMPLFDKYKNAVIKQCSILIFPEMKGHVKYLISVNDVHKVTDSPIIIYSVLTDSIQFVTSHFITEFQLDLQKVLSKTSQHNLLSNELFSRIDLASEQTRQLLRQQKPHNCELIVKQFAKANSKFEKLSINVSLINQFQTHSENFYILSVKRGTFIKTQVTITQFGLNKSTLGMTHENLNPVEKYRHEKFFCLIPNSYSIKITQKLSQVADSGRRNFVFYMRALFILGLLLLSGQILYSYFMTKQRISDLQSDQQLIYTKNNDIIEIAYMYSLLFKGQYFRSYPQVLKFINSNLNSTVVIAGYIAQMEITVRDFIESHLSSLRYTTSQAGIPYYLKFGNFQVASDTSKSTFIDFSENFSQYVKTFNKTFLFANYLSFRSVQEEFAQVDIITSQLQSTFSSSLLIIYITIIIAVPLSVIGLIISVKLEFCIDQMYKLLELLVQKDSQEVLRKINKLKEKIKEIQSIFQKNQEKNRSGDLQTVRILQLNQKVREDKQSQLHRKDEINVKVRSNDNKSQSSEESELLSVQVIEQKQEKKKQPQPIKQQNNHMQNDPILIILLRNIYALFFLVIVGILIYIQLNYRNNQIGVFQDLFTYQVQIFQTKGSILQLENDFFFKAENIQFYNPANFTFYESHSHESIHSYSNLQARSQFQAFRNQQELLLFGNLCNQSSNYFVDFDGLNCSTVADGVLTNGFSQAYAVYSKLATKLKNITLDQFLTQSCQNQTCPMFTDEIYLNIKLISLISNHIIKFRQFFNTLAQSQDNLNLQNLIISFGLIIVLTIAFSVWINLLAKRCRRSIKMFQVIPPYIMKKMKITTYIRKNNILSNLSIL